MAAVTPAQVLWHGMWVSSPQAERLLLVVFTEAQQSKLQGQVAYGEEDLEGTSDSPCFRPSQPSYGEKE